METKIIEVWTCVHSSEHGKRTHPMDGDCEEDIEMYDKSFTVRFEWKDGLPTDKKCGLMCYTDGYKASRSTGAGVYGYDTRQKLSFSLGQSMTVF
jgi:hypothetical protein